MILFKIAARNILRNRRRSMMTLSAIAVGAAALLCFGQFIGQTSLNFESGVVRNSGHLAVFKKGYFDFGGGDPSEYAIANYPATIQRIQSDPVIGPMVSVITPRVSFIGIGSSSETNTSMTVNVVGVLPGDFDKMRHWDSYGIMKDHPPPPVGFRDGDEPTAVIGPGLAKRLGLCGALKVPNCPSPPKPKTTGPAIPSYLANLSNTAAPVAQGPVAPQIDVLTATATGAPNVAGFKISLTEPQGVRELDDSYVRMSFPQAQKLLYGTATDQATAVVIQLRRTQDMAAAKDRLNRMFLAGGLDLEVRDMNELNPFYQQAVQFLQAIFLFIATILAVIVLFTVVNTMSMTVMERINEIGTARAIGVRRRGIAAQFILEGSILGALGATAGVVLSQLISVLLLVIKLKMVLPGTSDVIALKLLTSAAVVPLIGGVWAVLAVMAVIAALFPANRAGRMPVVDALRHV